jgi:hypothetical protein
VRRVTLGDHLDASVRVTKDTVEEALRDALRAQELLNVPAFRWWRNRIEKEVEKYYKKLAYSDGQMEQFHKRRGMVQGIEQMFRALDELASHVEAHETRLKEYANARKQA